MSSIERVSFIERVSVIERGCPLLRGCPMNKLVALVIHSLFVPPSSEERMPSL